MTVRRTVEPKDTGDAQRLSALSQNGSELGPSVDYSHFQD